MPEPDDATWTASAPQRPAAHVLASRIGAADALDEPADAVAAAVRGALAPGPLKDAISGTWLGHALHPLLTDVPIGTWTSATLLDLVGGEDGAGAAETLIAIGIAAAVPTAASGLVDWADTTLTDTEVKRVGVAHAVANTIALTLYSASLAARRRGSRRKGVILGLAGAGALAAGGHLGGHLSYAKGVGVDQTAFEPETDEWVDVLAERDLADGGGLPVMLTRQDRRVLALADRCNHRGGPLHEGDIADGCVTCPWHESVFRLSDGSVVRGPATFPQPVFDARVREGRIEIRSPTS
jgi:nitrite reductase/ring-hydroxylating ferredoxin subunit/uncharacterized membrane protein